MSVYAGGGGSRLQLLGLGKTLGGKTKAKNESSSPALLPAEWRLQKKKGNAKENPAIS